MSGDSPHSTPSTPTPPLASILDQLACPTCAGELRLDALALICNGCGRVYPIVDGIPVLIAEHAAANASSS